LAALRRAAGILALARAWERYEGPTWWVALAVYGGWFGLVRFHLLFLNNNYHVVHHAFPALPWFRIPAVRSPQRDGYIERSGVR
jgi:hypothetical protein